MKVSIIIPIYKVEQFIEDCLRSVYNQSYKNLEIILVDDCTPDDSMLIARNFVSKKELPKGMEIKFLSHKKNRGLSAARNTGIDAATGDYIYFLDSDDELSPDCISLLAEPLKKRQYDFIIGDYIITGSYNEYPPLKLEEGEYLGNQAIFHYYCHKLFYMMAWNKLCNLEFIKKEKLFFKEGLIHEDELWSLQVALVATSMYAIRKPTYVYKIRQGSITENENEREKIKFLIRVFKIIDDILKNDQIHSFKDVYQIYNDF